MTVVYRAASTPVGGTTSTISPTPPAGVTDGDILLLVILSNLNNQPAPSGSWTLVDAETGGTGNIRVFSKIAASEPANYTVTRVGSENYCAWVLGFYSDAAKTMYVDAHANAAYTSGTSRTWPGVTTTKASAGIALLQNTNSNVGTTPPTDFTEDIDSLIASGNRAYQAHDILSIAGATGDFTSTGGTSSTRVVVVAVAEREPPSAAPSDLGATAASATQIDLGWTDNASNETGYQIERSPNGSTGWTLIHTTAANANSYSNTGLSEHTIYYYRVRAVNTDGESAYTSTANATTLLIAPTGPAATAVSASQIDLSWTDNSGGEDGYKIERSPTGSGLWSQIDTVGANVTTYSDTGRSSNTTYYYRVRAYAGSDNSTYTSNASALTPLQTPTSPAVAARLSTKLRFTWSDANSDEDGFKVERSPDGAGSWSQIGTTADNVHTYDDTGLDPETTYYYRVRAYDGSNHSAYSSTASGETYAELVAPTDLAVLGLSTTEIAVSWSHIGAGVTGYSVERSPDGSTGWTEVDTVASSPYTDSGLDPLTTYYYRVRAYRDGSIEYSEYSDDAGGATLAPTTPVKHAHLFLLDPEIVFSARINLASATYPLDELPYDGVIDGAYTDVRVGMTVLIGSTLYADDLGRTRVRAAPDSDTLPIGRSSRGTRDGEIIASDNAYITVLDDFRVWAKIPYIEADGTIHKDSEISFVDQTLYSPPVANAGPGVAATISPNTGLITVAFDGTGSFATSDGGTVTDYAWDLKDYDTVTAGALDEASVTATFPAGFRWVALTVTDTDDKSHTAWAPVYARDPDDDGQPGGCIPHFGVEQQRIRPTGQEISFRIRHSIPAATYPDGTLALFWYGEPENAADRSHMQFIGWHQTDPAQVQSGRTATLTDVVIECVDVAGRLDSLPGFPQILEANADPENWSQMPAPNINKYLHYLLHWHSTALDVADWDWALNGEDYEFVILGSDGESLLDQINRRAKAMVPDHILTCNRRGQFYILPDPMLQEAADRTATVQAELTPSDYSDIRYTHNRPPRVHWLRGSALLASTSEITPVFCTAPGNAPGQGEIDQAHGEQLALSQSDLNNVTGHRYARANAPQGLFSISLLGSDDLGIEPALLTWITVSLTPGAQRGLTLTEARGLVQTLTIRYTPERSGLVRSVQIEWERETTGQPAITIVPPEAEPVDDGDNWTPPPVVDSDIIPPAITSGEDVIGLLDSRGCLYRTADFTDPTPTWDRVNDFETDFATANEVMSFVVDPFSPGYRGTGTAINGWVASEDGIWKITDMFGATPTATEVFTFDTSISIAFGGWRTINASFGRFQTEETDNPWIMVASHYNNFSSPTGTTVVYSVDGGQTWSTEIEVTNFYDYHYAEFAKAIHYPALWLSPRTPGLAYVTGYDPDIAIDAANTACSFVTTDWGATWAKHGGIFDPALPDINPGDLLGGNIHVPWPDNEDELVAYYGYTQHGSGGLNYTLRRSEPTGGASFLSDLLGGPQHGLFSVRTYDNDRRYVVQVAHENSDPSAPDQENDTVTVFVSDDYGDTWTAIYGPIDALVNEPFAIGAAFSANDQSAIYIWCSNREVFSTVDFGANVDDKSGNLASLGGGSAPIRGFFGGPLA